MLCRIALILLASVAISWLSPAHAVDLEIVGPPGSGAFGKQVVVLPNGNIVVTDPTGPVANIGAVYVYSPNGTLISTLTGGSSGDSVGSDGIQVLANGNFLVRSGSWRNPATAAANAGAITWVNAATGLSGVVSDGNSLVGTSVNDRVGYDLAVLLDTGNYVVRAPIWDNGPVTDAGAAIWGNGSVGISGPITTSNALFGTQSNDRVGSDVSPLSNGNYVVCSYVWDNGTITNAGAATWVNGGIGLVGAVSPVNSLVGTSINDFVSIGGIRALGDGNYVVSSYDWTNGMSTNAGAATWANGSVGRVGAVSSANSLVGTSAGDRVGDGSIYPLTNGNYVVFSPDWANGTSAKAGAATWGSHSGGVSGTISASNSLVGVNTDDGTSSSQVVALSNGNYVVVNPNWDNGAVADVGAVTWGNGASGRTGIISPANSLIGSTTSDRVGAGGTIAALANGNYVIGSAQWHNGASSSAGAATWGNGSSGRVGVVSAANSLVGSTTNDRVGSAIHPLENGNYVVVSESWDNGAIVDVGAVTLGDGSTGRIGVVSPANSLIGSSANDGYGRQLLALANGDFIAGSNRWDNGAIANVGAFTRVDGGAGLIGVPSAGNSILGSIAEDNVSYGTRAKLGNNHYAITSRNWDNGGIVDAGAVTILHNDARTRGLLTPVNSVFGTASSGGGFLNIDYDPVLDRAVVGRPFDNIVTVRALSLFADGFE